MVTNNIIRRVFRISHNGKTASAYTIEKGKYQFLVSAAHVFADCTEVNEIKIFFDDHWYKLPVKVVYNSLDTGDTIVFLLESDISPRTPVNYGPKGVILGSWAYFLGFPLSLNNIGKDLKFPLPLIKGGLISSIDGSLHELNTLFLDGHNNSGFSGGPVAWSANPRKNEPFSIIGTVSGYLAEFPKAGATQEDCDMFEVNAGIVKAHWITNLFDII